MPAIRIVLACVVAGAAIAVAIAASFRAQYREPEPAGPDEARVRQLMLGNEPLERRFAGLFDYFASGFVRHADLGYARVRYAGYASWNGHSVDGLEGFSRTAPLLAAWIHSGRNDGTTVTVGGRKADLLGMLRQGILNGVDSHSPDYWGDVTDRNQRIVEAADVARVLWLTRSGLWDKLTAVQKASVNTWLLAAANADTARNNWMLFPVLISLVLLDLNTDGLPPGLLARARATFSEYREYYLDHGWFFDRPNGVDFYNTWGISYDLFWIHAVNPAFEPQFIVGALEQSAALTQYLISPAGIPIMGRSVCYRTAVPVPLVAATLLNSSSFPTGRAVRGLDVVWRYFVAHGSLQDGALTQGYFSTDPRLIDRYSGTGSCHWGLRSLVLAFMHPAADSFWSAAPQPLPVEESDYRLELTKLGWTVEGRRDSGEIRITVALNPADVNRIEPFSLRARVKERVLNTPLRPENRAVKYGSKHYSSAAPFPLFTNP